MILLMLVVTGCRHVGCGVVCCVFRAVNYLIDMEIAQYQAAAAAAAVDADDNSGYRNSNRNSTGSSTDGTHYCSSKDAGHCPLLELLLLSRLQMMAAAAAAQDNSSPSSQQQQQQQARPGRAPRTACVCGEPLLVLGVERWVAVSANKRGMTSNHSSSSSSRRSQFLPFVLCEVSQSVSQ